MRTIALKMGSLMLDALLPWVRRDILVLLFSHPDRELYMREIARAVGGGTGAVERELRTLSRVGIVIRQKRGNRTYYRANQDCPIYPELHGLVVKTAGVADILREALGQIPRIHLAFIYGSMARGTPDAQSDVDVLVVSDASFADISSALLPAQERLGREVTPSVYTPQEFTDRMRGKHHFLMRVLSEPRIMLIGTPDDLAAMGGPAPE